MNKILWSDARVDKPKNEDPVIALTSNGCIVVAQWDGSKWCRIYFTPWMEDIRPLLQGVSV